MRQSDTFPPPLHFLPASLINRGTTSIRESFIFRSTSLSVVLPRIGEQISETKFLWIYVYVSDSSIGDNQVLCGWLSHQACTSFGGKQGKKRDAVIRFHHVSVCQSILSTHEEMSLVHVTTNRWWLNVVE